MSYLSLRHREKYIDITSPKAGTDFGLETELSKSYQKNNTVRPTFYLIVSAIFSL